MYLFQYDYCARSWMAMTLLIPPGISPMFHPVGNSSKEEKGQLIFLLSHQSHSYVLRATMLQLGPSCSSPDKTLLLVTELGSRFVCCLVKALSEVKHKLGLSLLLSQECAYLIQA